MIAMLLPSCAPRSDGVRGRGAEGGASGAAGSPLGGSAGLAGNGRAGAGGTAAGGSPGGSAGATDDPCATPLIREYCELTAPPCSEAAEAVDWCVRGLAYERCSGPSAMTGCTPEYDSLMSCKLGGTPSCGPVGVSNVDCRSEGDVYYACMGWIWSCHGTPDYACLCERVSSGISDNCQLNRPCCRMDAQNMSCLCTAQENCALYPSPPWYPVDACPPP